MSGKKFTLSTFSATLKDIVKQVENEGDEDEDESDGDGDDEETSDNLNANNATSNEKRRSSLVEILKQEKLQRISKNASEKKKQAKANPHIINVGEIDENEFGPLPPPDYYYKTDAMYVDNVGGNENEDGQLHYTPVGNNT
jgi:hypothetical protein